MKQLQISNLFDRTKEEIVDKFQDNLNSNVNVKIDCEKINIEFEWIDIFEQTVPYLYKILANPNRFIINDENIVKVELAKKTNYESVLHLSKHSNLVRKVDKETGEVQPEKILEISKEETLNVYENRFIYSLIKNMIDFVEHKKELLNKHSRLKDTKEIGYVGVTSVGQEIIDVNLLLKTKLNAQVNKADGITKRIKELEKNIKSLQTSEVYINLEKENTKLVENPIKKTNVLLKNVNFQYAVKLWDYISDNFNDNDSVQKQKKNYIEQGITKELLDESFLLQYLALNTLNESKDKKEYTVDAAIDSMLDKIIDLKPNLTKKQLQDKLGIKFDNKKKKVINSKVDIEKLFRKHIDKYLEKVNKIKL